MTFHGDRRSQQLATPVRVSRVWRIETLSPLRTVSWHPEPSEGQLQGWRRRTVVQGPPGEQGDTTAGFENTHHLRHRPRGIAHEHNAETAGYTVHTIMADRDSLRIALQALNLGFEPKFPGMCFREQKTSERAIYGDDFARCEAPSDA